MTLKQLLSRVEAAIDPAARKAAISEQPKPESTQKNEIHPIIKALNNWFQIREDMLIALSTFYECAVHTIQLIEDKLDQIEVPHPNDQLDLFNLPHMINSVNQELMESILEVASKFETEQCIPFIRALTKRISDSYFGAGLEVQWRNSYSCPTEQEWIDAAKLKTGSLLYLIVQLMQLYKDDEDDKRDFSSLILDKLGPFCQLCTELNKFNSTFGNELYDSLTRGSYSFPVLYALKHYGSKDLAFQKILYKRTSNPELHKHARDLIIQSGAVQSMESQIKDLHSEILQEMDSLGQNEQFEHLLNEIRNH